MDEEKRQKEIEELLKKLQGLMQGGADPKDSKLTAEQTAGSQINQQPASRKTKSLYISVVVCVIIAFGSFVVFMVTKSGEQTNQLPPANGQYLPTNTILYEEFESHNMNPDLILMKVPGATDEIEDGLLKLSQNEAIYNEKNLVPNISLSTSQPLRGRYKMYAKLRAGKDVSLAMMIIDNPYHRGLRSSRHVARLVFEAQCDDKAECVLGTWYYNSEGRWSWHPQEKKWQHDRVYVNTWKDELYIWVEKFDDGVYIVSANGGNAFGVSPGWIEDANGKENPRL